MEDSDDVTKASDQGSEHSTEAKMNTDNGEGLFKSPAVAPVKPHSGDPLIKQPLDFSKYYNPPTWSHSCPSTSKYFLEVIKNGTTLTEDTVSLSDVDHCIFGRQPGSLLNPQSTTGRISTLLHPSISRSHAVLQFGCNSDVSPGWYIYDLDSTHGTFVNKCRVLPRRYFRLRVGYVLRFGSSTRLLILNGPPSDVEAETKESWCELVAKKKSKNASSAQMAEELNGKGHDVECNWGIADDVDDELALQQRLADSTNCLSHEKSYIEDPKKSLRAFFEREGLDPLPEYDFVEGRFGQQLCRIELPLELGTVFAEVSVSGRKRKEAIVECALEACRMLDRLGQFDANKDGAEAIRRTREKAHLQSNDYYSSDEDTFLDRTGQIEIRRRRRMRRMGVEQTDTTEVVDLGLKGTSAETEDSLSTLATLETLGKTIIEVEKELNAAERAMEASVENASEMDELEAYMEAVKRGAPKRAERQALKRRLVALRQEEIRLLRKVGIRGGGVSGARFSSSASSAAATAVRAVAAQSSESDTAGIDSNLTECTPNSIKKQLTKVNISKLPSTRKFQVEEDEEFVPEVEEDDDVHSIELKTESPKSVGEVVDVARKETLKRPLSPPSQSVSIQSKVIITEGNGEENAYEDEDSSPLSAKVMHSISLSASKMEPVKAVDEGPLPPIASVSDQVTMEEHSPIVSIKSPPSPSSSLKNEDYDCNINDPHFSLWLPPEDQSGDGVTRLNEKYGY